MGDVYINLAGHGADYRSVGNQTTDGGIYPQDRYSTDIETSQYEFDKMRPTLLVVDDEIEMLWFIGEIFSADFNVVTLQDPERLDR